MNKLINNIADDVVVISRAINQIFWEVVDEAQHTRSRLRIRREILRLSEQERALYEQLGQVGFDLLRERISVERTPEASQMLVEIEQQQIEQQRLRNLSDATALFEDPPFPWYRLMRLLETGEWTIHLQVLPESSPWCGRQMMVRPLTGGLCLAIKRGDATQPFTPNTVCLGGDLFVIVAPASSILVWNQWIVDGPSNGTTATTV